MYYKVRKNLAIMQRFGPFSGQAVLIRVKMSPCYARMSPNSGVARPLYLLKMKAEAKAEARDRN